MAVITFVNNKEEESGKTMSLVAIATNMSIEYNNKILIISTTNREDKIKDCFFKEKEVKRMRVGLFGMNTSSLDTENGIEGIAKMLRSNKLTPEMVTNYTRVVFKDRLEILLGSEKEKKQEIDEDKKEITDEYIEIINIASRYYDKVLVDLDYNLNEEIRNRIMDKSDIVIVNSTQGLKNLESLRENKQNNILLKSPKTLILIGKYDKNSKYNIKNITRYLEEKNQVLTVPYNTLYFEACEETEVPDLFLRLRKLSDSDDINTFFINEVKRASEAITYRLQELDAKMI